MKMLGHRHFKMTLRYAVITQEIIRKEYNAAIEKIDRDLDLMGAQSPSHGLSFNPEEVLPDLIRWIRQNAPADPSQKLLIRKIQKIEREMKGSFKKYNQECLGHP